MYFVKLWFSTWSLKEMLQISYNIYLFLLTQSMSKSFIFPTKAYTNELCDLSIICWFSITHFDSYPTFQGPVSSAQWYSGQWQQKDASNLHKYEQINMNSITKLDSVFQVSFLSHRHAFAGSPCGWKVRQGQYLELLLLLCHQLRMT